MSHNLFDTLNYYDLCVNSHLSTIVEHRVLFLCFAGFRHTAYCKRIAPKVNIITHKLRPLMDVVLILGHWLTRCTEKKYFVFRYTQTEAARTLFMVLFFNASLNQHSFHTSNFFLSKQSPWSHYTCIWQSSIWHVYDYCWYPLKWHG